jgi:TPR repeat protein
LFAEGALGEGADLDSPYARFIASKWRDLAKQAAAAGLSRTDLPAIRANLFAGEWNKLSDAEKAAFTSPPSFAAAFRVRVPTDEASSSSTATAAADGKGDATVSAAASTSAAADRAPPELGPDEGTAYVEKLESFVKSYVVALGNDLLSWVQSEYGGDMRRLRADADRGNAKAQFAMSCYSTPNEASDMCEASGMAEWARIHKSAELGYGDAVLAMAMMGVGTAADAFTEEHITALRNAIDLTGSPEAQHAIGLVESIRQQPTVDKDDVLETARWFRAAAHQGLKEAQWELGEMFRKGAFCDVHMFFARQYIKRAARQGHAEALQRVKELCRCVYCGAGKAPWKCSTCLETRYCDAECSKKHWRRGGGVSEVCEAALPLRKTCPRTYDDPCE